jgi:hypothetical protein
VQSSIGRFARRSGNYWNVFDSQGRQGPSLAYAAAAAAKTMPASCASHILGQSGNDDSCCPQSMPGVCCAGALVVTGMPSAPVTLPPEFALVRVSLSGVRAARLRPSCRAHSLS